MNKLTEILMQCWNEGKDPNGKTNLVAASDAEAAINKYISENYMTGQQWAERFEKILTAMPCDQRFITGDGLDTTTTITHSMQQVREAANKAAGITAQGDKT